MKKTTITQKRYDQLKYENKINNDIIYQIVEVENDEIFPYIIVLN